jgi:hypothetical protein
VYTESPCRGATLVPVSGNGCIGTVCSGDASSAICSTTGQVDNMTVACEPSPLPCGWSTLGTAGSLVYASGCSVDSDCPGNASCSEGICYGTACPTGDVCSALAYNAVCVKSDGGAPEAGVAEAGVGEGGVAEGGAVEGGLTEAGAPEAGASEAGALDGGAPDGGAADSAADSSTD